MSQPPLGSPLARTALGLLALTIILATPLAAGYAQASASEGDRGAPPSEDRAPVALYGTLPPAQATYVVNSAAHPGTGGCDAVECTLGEAIAASNQSAGFDRIEFNVNTSGAPAVIFLGGTPLPAITGQVHIDGYTQPGSSRGGAADRPTIRVLIAGNGLPDSYPNGLVVLGAGGRIEGLNLQGFAGGAAILLRGEAVVDYDIMGNFIGTSIYGTDCYSNVEIGSSGGLYGVVVRDRASANYVGARDGLKGNIIGCNETGVLLEGGATGTSVAGNEVVSNTEVGISVEGPGTSGTTLDGNLVAGNGRGIVVQAGAAGTEVTWNNIGANTGSGVRVEAGWGGSPTGTTVSSNAIGHYRARTAFPVQAAGPAPNLGRGVYVYNADGTSILNNVVSSNDEWGVEVRESDEVVVGYNAIGPSPQGTATVGNRYGGVRVRDAYGTAIHYNVISGNRESGSRTTAADGIALLRADETEIVGNLIGIDLAGNPLPNTGRGIAIVESSNTRLGDSDEASANQIAHNGAAGVYIGGSTSEAGTTGNWIRRSRIWRNDGLEIDLGGNGRADATDPAGIGTGPNRMVNAPLLLGLRESGGAVQVQVNLAGVPNGRYAIQFYESDRADGSGGGEGQRLLTKVERSANSEGLLAFETSPIPMSPGTFLSATATDTGNNTSEFSNAVISKNATRVPVGPATGAVSVGVPGTPGYVVFHNVTAVRPGELQVTVSETDQAALRICLPQAPPANAVCQTVNVQTGVVSVATVGGVSFTPSVGLVAEPPPGSVAVLVAQAPNGFLAPLLTILTSDAAGNPLASAVTAANTFARPFLTGIEVVLALAAESGLLTGTLLDQGLDYIKAEAQKRGIPVAPLIGMDGATFIESARASLIGMDGATLVGMDGATLIGMDGSTLIGMDGATLIGMDGASIFPSGQAALIGADGSTLIGNDAGSLVGNDGASRVANDGRERTGGGTDDGVRLRGAEAEVGPPTRFVVAFVPAVQLSARVLLDGALDGAAGPMRADLRAEAAFPAHQPYNQPPYAEGPAAISAETFLPTSYLEAHPEIVDWVVVEIRTAPEPTDRAFRRAALLLDDGRVVDYSLGPVQFLGVEPGSYYAAVYHRNHLGARTASPLDFTSGAASVDFAAAGTVADDASRREVAPGVFALRTGDVDADGVLRPDDRTAWFTVNDRRYSPADLDLSGESTAADYHHRLLPALGVVRPTAASAPGTVEGRLLVAAPEPDGTVAATVQLRAPDGTGDLGTSTLHLTFDPSTLAFLDGALALPTEGGTSFAAERAVHVSGPGVVAIDLDLVASADGQGVPFGSDFTDVAVLRFDVQTGGAVGAFAWGLREVYDGVGGAGGQFALGPFTVETEGNVAEESGTQRPEALALSVGPNPARGLVRVRFGLPSGGAARVVLLDALGREVLVLAEAARPAGWHEVHVDTAALATGVYLVRVTNGGASHAQRFSVVR